MMMMMMREENLRWKPWSLYNLILGVTFCHICYILFVRSESVSLAHIPGEEVTQGHEYQETEITGDCLINCLTQKVRHMIKNITCQQVRNSVKKKTHQLKISKLSFKLNCH